MNLIPGNSWETTFSCIGEHTWSCLARIHEFIMNFLELRVHLSYHTNVNSNEKRKCEQQ